MDIVVDNYFLVKDNFMETAFAVGAKKGHNDWGSYQPNISQTNIEFCS